MPTQDLKTHARFDPSYHFTLLPLAFAIFVAAVVHAVQQPITTNIEVAILAFTVVFATFKTRVYALQNQDRLIRLEEHLRLHRLMPTEPETIAALTIGQLIALRFASDAELPALARRAVTESLSRSAIKAAITTWRPDEHRI